MDTEKILAVVNQLTVQQEHKGIVKWKPTEIGDENEFTKALQQNQIAKSTIEDITSVLRLVMLKVGIRTEKLPSSEETDVLIDHILTNYGNHTPAEIKLAFDMAISGKLEDVNGRGEPVDLDVSPYYGEFNCIYFSRIMNAYRRWARQTFNQLKMEQQVPMEEMETIDVVDMIEDWRKDENLKMQLIPLFFYEFLFDTGIIKLTDEQKWEWWRKARESVKAELIANLPTDSVVVNDDVRDWRTFMECEKTNRWDMVTNGKIGNRAKRLIVYEYLTKK